MFRRVAEDGNAAREDLLDSLHLLCALCYTGVCPRHREMTVMCAQHDLQLRNCKKQPMPKAAHAWCRCDRCHGPVVRKRRLMFLHRHL